MNNRNCHKYRREVFYQLTICWYWIMSQSSIHQVWLNPRFDFLCIPIPPLNGRMFIYSCFSRRECFAETWKSMPSHATRWSVPAIKLANGSVHWMSLDSRRFKGSNWMPSHTARLQVRVRRVAWYSQHTWGVDHGNSRKVWHGLAQVECLMI